MAFDRPSFCSRFGCRNPCADGEASERMLCGKHGGETKETWAIYRHNQGWLMKFADGDTPQLHSMDVDDALWFFDRNEASATIRSSVFSSFYELVRVK